MLKKILLVLLAMSMAGVIVAQPRFNRHSSSRASKRGDNISLYSIDGGKMLYNVSEDIGVQTGNAIDALRNAPGVEVDAEGNISYRGGAAVDIWINDKPLHLKAEALKQYLKSFPAAMLQRIEVIARPTAKYHTQNSVINIVTNAKVMNDQLLCLGLNANSRPQIGPWVDYMLANDNMRFNIFLSGVYERYNSEANSNSRLLAPDNTLSSIISTEDRIRNHTWSGNFGVDFDYYLNSTTTLSFWLWAAASHDSCATSSLTERAESISSPGSYLYKDNFRNGNSLTDAAFGVRLEKKFDNLGGMFSIDYSGTLMRNYLYDTDRRKYDSLTSLNFNRNIVTRNPSQWHGITADLALPYGDYGEINFGLRGSLAPEQKDVEATRKNKIDSLRSYSFTNGTRELSLYAGTVYRVDDFTLSASLSMDNAWYNLDYADADSGDVKKHYLTFCPTIHVSYNSSSTDIFTFSYTHYVVPPTAAQLTRFTVYGYDGYTTGNPTLSNGHANNFELGWNRNLDEFGNIGFNAWFNSDLDRTGTLTDVAYCDRFGRIVAFDQSANIGTARQGGIALNATLRPLDFMRIRFYANLYDDFYSVQYRPGSWQESERICYSLQFNFWMKVLENTPISWFDGLQFFVNAVYRSRTQTPLAEADPYFAFDCGFSTDLYERRLSLFLNVNDLFGTVHTKVNGINPYNPFVSENTTESRYIGLGLTLRLGDTGTDSRRSHGRKRTRRRR